MASLGNRLVISATDMHVHLCVRCTAFLVAFSSIATAIEPELAGDWSLPDPQVSTDATIEWFEKDRYSLSAAPVDRHLSDAALACDAPGWTTGKPGISYSPGFPSKPHREQPGDIDRGDCPPYRYGLSDCQRAGNPHQVAWWAATSVNQRYSAGFVGGGAAFRGRSRLPSEGTWGLDYHGLLPLHRVWLKWTCGRERGGEGAYQTDGHTGPWSHR